MSQAPVLIMTPCGLNTISCEVACSSTKKKCCKKYKKKGKTNCKRCPKL